MKKLCTCICLLAVSFTLCPATSFSQNYLDPKGIVQSEIKRLVKQRFGRDFEYVGYSMLDSLIHYSTIEKNFRRQDPFNTLKGCVLFCAYKGKRELEKDTFIIGMVKDGKIIWDNAPGTRAYLGGDLLYAQDINNDGEVDLIFREVDYWLLKIGRAPSLYYLDVLSWDGARGKFINAFDRSGKSVLWSNGGCELVTQKGSKIRDIRTSLSNVPDVPAKYTTNAFPAITYTWNGKLYGLWPQTAPKNRTQKKN